VLLALIVRTIHKVLFGTKKMFLTFENSETKAYFLSKSDVLVSEKYCATPSFSLH
jgi:hypothetical protein